MAGAGYIHPTRINEALCYTSSDLRLLRVAKALHSVRIPAPKILAALEEIEKVLPAEESGRAIVWEAGGAPHQLPSILDIRAPTRTTRARREAAERRRQEAAQHFENAVALEDSDLDAAREAYMAALASHGEHLEARINLGRLLHLQGDLAEAEKIYRAAKHSSALLSFNLGILLEDLSREEEAVVAYREALALDPSFHDAHYNLSRLHELADRPQEALRHLLAYRRHRERDEE
jgi:tetratricopeptide (TPR) repeat protein